MAPSKPSCEEELTTWEKENIVRKYWISKYPFLDEHSKQIELANDEKIIKEAKRLQKVDNAYDSNEYQGLSLLFNEQHKKIPEKDAKKNLLDTD